MSIQPDWLTWARKLQALAQTGLTYAQNQYDKERYRQLQAVAAEIFVAHTGETLASVEQWFAIQPGYATPKVDVRGACFRDGKVLRVRERSDGAWCLPGGWADVGDVPSNAAEREVHEEAGFECVARKVIGIFDCNRGGGEPLAAYHAFKVIYACAIKPGLPQGQTDVLINQRPVAHWSFNYDDQGKSYRTTVEVDPKLLRVGENKLEVVGSRCRLGNFEVVRFNGITLAM